MKKKLLVGLLLTIILIGATVLWFLQDRASAPSAPPQNAKDLPLKEGIVTVTGEVICLPHANTSGPQTLECAIGIKDDSGVNYALSSEDPSQTGSLTGKRVEITGWLERPDSSTQYDTTGTLHVQSVKQL